MASHFFSSISGKCKWLELKSPQIYQFWQAFLTKIEKTKEKEANASNSPATSYHHF